MLGIGLGGFVDGFKEGYGLRLSMQEEREKQDLKNKIGAIDTDAKTAFDKEMAAGTVSKGDFDKFWMDYALPKMAHERLLAGDIGGAKSLMDWGQSQDAMDGARDFGAALVNLNAGNYDGAIKSALSAADNKGYLSHGLKLDSHDKLVNKNGDVLGYRFTFTDQNGDQQTKDVPLNEMDTFIAGLANPEAAFQSQQNAAADDAKRKRDMADFKTKEAYKAGLKGTEGTNKDRSSAISALRKRMPSDNLDGNPGFDDLPRAEQDKLIAKEIRLQQGTPAPAAPTPEKVIVDKGTGEKVSPEGVTGLGATPAPQPRGRPGDRMPQSNASRLGQQIGEMSGTLPAPAAETIGLGGTPVTRSRPQQEPNPGAQRAQILQEASRMLQNGGNPQVIAQRLQKAGIPAADIDGLIGQPAQ